MAGNGQDERRPGEPLGIDHNQGHDTGNHQEEASVSLSSFLCLSISLSLSFRQQAVLHVVFRRHRAGAGVVQKAL